MLKTSPRFLPLTSLALLLAACSPSSVLTPPEVKTDVTLKVANSAQLGEYVTDSTGTSLYLFIKDTRGANATTCLDACATTWPALTFDPTREALATAMPSNLNPALLGSFVRADNGKTQATYNGWPLYRFSKDLKAGDTTGQNVGGVWFLLKPDGTRNQPAPTAITFTTDLNSANEVPAVTVASMGTGTVTGTLDGNKLTVSGTFKWLTGAATVAHIHGPANTRSTGPVLFPLTLVNDAIVGNGSVTGSVDLSADQLSQLKAGSLYFNIHTAANKPGEIRGQIILPGTVVTPAPVAPAPAAFSATLNSANEVPALKAPVAGTGSVTATFDGMNLTLKGTFKGLTGPATVAHIHGPASKTATGPVVVPLTFTNDATAGSGTLSAEVMLMGAQATALNDGQLYVNVHTAANPTGEIRGQIEAGTTNANPY